MNSLSSLKRGILVVAALGSMGALAQPVNDLCTGAEVIPSTGAFPKLSTVVSLTGANIEAASPMSCRATYNSSVWYSFTPSTTALYTVATCAPTGNTLSDTALAIYTGTCAGTTEVGCNDDFCGFKSSVSMTLTAGVTYYVQVAKFGATLPLSTDTMQLQIDQILQPTNDSCSGTVPSLALNTPVLATTNTLTLDDSRTSGNACFTGIGHSATATINAAPGRDLVYSFTPPSSGQYSVRLGFNTAAANGILYLSDSCVAPMTPPQIYAPPQCIAAANRGGASSTAGEEISCVSLTQNVPVYVWVDEGAQSTSGSTAELEVTACTQESEPATPASNNTPATANALACPSTGAINPAGDVDFYSLGTNPTGSRLFAMVEANTSGVTGSASTDFDLRVTSATDTLEYDDTDVSTAFGGSSGAVAGTPLPNAPAYVRVSHFSATTALEPYRLHTAVQTGTATLEVEPNDTLAQATAAVGNYFSGDLTTSADVDHFAFTAKTGDLLFLALDEQPARSGTAATANHQMQLLDATGAVLASANNSATTVSNTVVTGALTTSSPNVPSQTLVYRVRTNGLYYARVNRTSATGTTPYALSIATNCTTGGGIGAPTAASITPATGSIVGGTSVTITGTGFNAATGVKIGGNAATITGRTATSLIATTPAGNVGAVDVVVTNPGNQTSTLTGGFTYFEPIIPPTVVSVTPASGPTAGGTVITINGTIFKAGAEVSLSVGGVSLPATNVTVVTSARLTATTPASAAGLATVTVRNPVDALEGSLADAFTFFAPPAITGLTPSTGLTTGGTVVTVTGTAFRAGAIVRFGPTAGTAVTVDPSGTSLTVTSPLVTTAGPVNVTVTNVDSQASTGTTTFTYSYPAPTLTTITPNSGFAIGGQTITLTGTGFLTGATVNIGGTAATNVTRLSGTSVTLTTPPGAAGPADVVLTNSDAQSVTSVGGFRFVPAPVVTALTPVHGPVQGGTRITLTGSNFLPGAVVQLSGVPAFAVNVVDATTITAVTNGAAAGVVDAKVINPDTQNSTLPMAFTYDGAPTLTSLTPVSGSTAGGTVVTLTGTGFLAGASVVFGTTAATNVTVTSPTELTAVTPARPVGVVSVTIANSDNQSASLQRAYRFVAPPTLTSLAPTTGDVTGGTVVHLTGAGFAAGSTVRFGGLDSPQVTFVSDTTLDAVTPAHGPGAVDVEVSTNGAAATLAGGFTYTRGAPTLTAVAPVSGTLSGGTLLTLTGTGFAAGATVTLGGVAATDVVIVSSVLARVVTPAHAVGAVDVVLTNDDQQKATLAAGYTYTAPATSGTGTLTDGGSGVVGTEPVGGGTGNTAGGVSCGCTSFDGSMFSLGGMGLLMVLSRRRRRS